MEKQGLLNVVCALAVRFKTYSDSIRFMVDLYEDVPPEKPDV